MQYLPSSCPPRFLRAGGGYRDSSYARSMVGVGEPYHLERSGGWMLARPIPGIDRHDLMGPYPLFACKDWSQLHADLEATAGSFVSAYLVTDPFGDYAVEQLHRHFPDVCRPFKQHVVVDLEGAPLDGVCAHHRRYARKSLRTISVEICDQPRRHLGIWIDLYRNLIARHDIRGVAAFSAETFARQFDVPGLLAMRAADRTGTVGMVLWYVHDAVAYYHLGAFSERGYRAWASFGIFWTAIEHFTGRMQWLDLGASAGVHSRDDGLAQFKSGWSADTRAVFFCGRILDRVAYARLAGNGHDPRGHFPAYRAGEFSQHRPSGRGGI